MVQRISGLVSGMNTDDLVSKMMAAERMPLDSLNQKKQFIDWQTEDYRMINSKVLDFRNTVFNMTLQSTFLAQKATSGDDNTVSVNATANAVDGNFTVQVNALAKSASVTSGLLVSGDGDSTKTMGNLGLTADTNLFIGGDKGTTAVSIGTSDTIAQVVSKINGKFSSTGVRANYDTNLNRLFFVSSSTGASSKINLNATDNSLLSSVLKINSNNFVGSTTFPSSSQVINSTLTSTQTLTISYSGSASPYSFSIDKNTTVGQLINDINKSDLAKAGVTAFLDKYGKLAFYNPDSSKTISFSDQTSDTVDIVANLGLKTSVSPLGNTLTGTVNFNNGTTSIVPANIKSAQSLQIQYNNVDYNVTVSPSQTVGELVDDINNSGLSKAGVTAYLDSNGKLALFNSDASKTIAFSDTTNDGTDVVQELGLANPSTTAGSSYGFITSSGTNAEIIFNGVEGEFTTNTFTTNGMTFTAKQANSTPVNVSVSPDVDTIFNSIKGFVDKYNDLLSSMNSKLSETRNYDYQPLTDNQKEKMKDSEIESWNAKARSGLLANDTIMQTGVNSFRFSLSNPVSGLPAGSMNTLSAIGITTGVYQDQGKLYINEGALKDAISNHPEQVMQAFTAQGTSDSSQGLAVRLYNQAKTLMDNITNKAGNAGSITSTYLLGQDEQDLNDSITRMNDRLSKLENQYYDQFSAMETAIQKLNSQSTYLAQFAGGK